MHALGHRLLHGSFSGCASPLPRNLSRVTQNFQALLTILSAEAFSHRAAHSPKSRAASLKQVLIACYFGQYCWTKSVIASRHRGQDPVTNWGFTLRAVGSIGRLKGVFSSFRLKKALRGLKSPSFLCFIFLLTCIRL